MLDLNAFLAQTASASQEAFKTQKRILSFKQYLEAFAADPMRMGRNAPQYLLDCYDHFGTEKVEGIGGKATRFKLFDAPFDGGRDKLIGHERVQQEVYALLRRFAATGRADRLVMLHGPNGSGKSSFIDVLFRALEYYSTIDAGALFRFNWIFSERAEGKSHLGFGSEKGDLPKDTLAFIEENLVSCKIPCEQRECPLFLVPRSERDKLLDALIAAAPEDAARRERLKGAYLREGQLSAKSKAIYDALITAYRGEWQKVIRHVQVERYFISKRFRVGASVIEPQQSVDAASRPTSYEHGVSLPPVLQGLLLWDLVGELIDGCGGMVEYSDFLKRPIEMNKYLLNTCERGTIALPGGVAHLNTVLIGSCNEKYLSAFKANPDFTSFKGRMELVRIGYLLEWKKEREIYRDFIGDIRRGRHVAPHTLDVAALWAAMTRVRRPDAGKYESDLGAVLRKLTPLQKVRLYGEGRAPDGLTTEEKRLLLSSIAPLRDEHLDSTAEFENFVCAAYEGRRGASAREMRSLLAEAAEIPDHPCLTPLAVFSSIRELLKDRSVYDFLRLESDEGYHDCERFLEEAREEYFRWISVEIYDSMELIEESEFGRRVDEYFRHLRAYVAGEKIENERTGKFESPSEEVMKGLEKLMNLKEAPDGFRKNLMTKIAAYSLEHLKEKLHYGEIFPDLLSGLRDSYYHEKQKPLEALARYVLASGAEDDALVPAAERPRVERTLKLMREKYGYCDRCAKEVISFMLRTLAEK